jgi:hypothetical protein
VTRPIAFAVRLVFVITVLAPLLALAAPLARTKDASAPDARASASSTASALAIAASASASAADTVALPSAGPLASAASSASAPVPAASASPSTAPAAPSSASPLPAAVVHIHDRKVFIVKLARGGQSASERAADASRALERAVEEAGNPEVRVDEKPDVAIVYVGDYPVIQLGPDDAAAEGDASLSVHAASVAAKVRDAVAAERKRSALATTVFSFSLLVFSALIVVLSIGKLGQLVTRGREWIAAHPERLPNVRAAGIEVIGPAALRGGILVAIDASKWLLRLGLGYGWVLLALSLFDATRSYSERLTGFVLAPLSALMGRAASALPVLIVAAIAAIALLLLVRFVGLFFNSVARGETSLAWLPVDLAGPTSVLVRAGLVLVSLVLAAPLVTGSADDALSRAGLVALVALGLATTPLLACAAVGTAVLFGRRLKVGEFAEVGGRSGVVRSLTLLEVSMEDANGCDVRIPHLATLLVPTRVLGFVPPIAVQIAVGANAAPARVLELLSSAAATVGDSPRVELVHVDADGATYRVTVFSAAKGAKSGLLTSLADALAKERIALGRSPRGTTS